MQPRTKLSILLEHMDAGRWQEAFRIAARFQDLGAQRAAILDAHSAYTSPAWMRQLGRDPDEAIKAGIAALRARYVKD